MARVVKPVDKDAAHQLLRLSAEKYSSSLQWNPHNPQVESQDFCMKLFFILRFDML